MDEDDSSGEVRAVGSMAGFATYCSQSERDRQMSMPDFQNCMLPLLRVKKADSDYFAED